jgi:hypothetical protein
MATLRTPQQHIRLHGRDLHFVAYEEQPANVRRGIAMVPAMWYMMAGTNRCSVMQFDPDQPAPDVVRALTQWAECNAFGANPDKVPEPPKVTRPERSRWEE